MGCSIGCTLITAIISILVFAIAKFFYNLFTCHRSRPSKPTINKKNWEHDVVYLYQFPRSKSVPNASPFCLKVETFLRHYKINHEIVESLSLRSKEGKVPFVELNGEQIADSQLIILALMKHVSITDNLNPEQEGMVRAISRMVEHGTFGRLLYCATLYVSCKYILRFQLDYAIDAEPHITDGAQVKLNYATSEFDVLVTSLTPNITEKMLSDYFSRYGELRGCEIKESLPAVRAEFVGFWSEKEKFDIYTGNLPFDATDDSLFKIFSKYGKIVHREVKRDRNTNRSLGYGYVSFQKAEEVVQAVNGAPHILNGRTLKVDSNKRLTLSKKIHHIGA
ncbi:RNA recognition motif domain-containing protein [Ditylenchus destructor]|uniref:RNA recognition motif domain-containing protein n=1 Tax=Ditylenchus destructor TaxID=166010 RepID=A0AAD4MJD3_9BILA|nr:RNA recognition motif domain-containing protein [Ditylenchus destructor]